MKAMKQRPASPGAWALAVALAAILPWRGAAAEEAKDPTGDGARVELVEEIEVKGKRPTRSASLEVREIRETSARDMGEALDGLADLAKVRRAGVANDVVLRGLKRDNIAVLIDGQQLHGACPGRMDPPASHVDYAEVDRVEVKKGPFDVTHPGGLGGLVDVRTRGTRRSGWGAELNLHVGAAGARETSGVLSWERGGFDVLGGASYKAGDPFESGDGRRVTEVIPPTRPTRFRPGVATQTAYDVRSAWAKVGLAPLEGHRLEVSYTRQSSVDVLYPALAMDGVTDDTDRLNVQYALGPAGALRRGFAQVYWNRVVHDMTDARRCSSTAVLADCSGTLPRGYGMRGLTRSSTLGAKVEAELGGGWLAGADLASRRWDATGTTFNRTAQTYGDERSIPDVTVDDVGVFGQLGRRLGERLTLTVGARLDVAHAKAGVDRSALYAQFRPGEDLPRSRTDVLPSGNVQLELAPERGPILFLGLGHGARMPDPQELYNANTPMGTMAGYVGHPGIDATTNDEIDAGAKWVRDGVLVKGQLFHAWLTDYISLVETTAPGGAARARTFRNVSARTFGGEASARVSLPLRLYASAGVSFTRGVNETTGGSLAEIPPLKGVVALRWDARWLFVEAEEVMAADQHRVDGALREAPTGGWGITNLRAGGEWRGVKLFAGVRNLFDRFYFEHLSYHRDPYLTGVRVPEPGRTLYVNAQYQR